MTGKELLLVLAGTAAAAGAGGVGAAALMSDKPADSGVDTAVLDQLKKLGKSIDSTNEIMSESRDEIAGLKNRIIAVESGLRGVPAARIAASGRHRVDASRHAAASNAQVLETGEGEQIDFQHNADGLPEEAQKQLRVALGKLKAELGSMDRGALLGGVVGKDGEMLGGLSGLSGHLKGLSNSFALRRLPEEERWQKARDEVGLTNVQEDEIKSALAERDQAIEDSMQIKRDESDGTSRISVRSMDFAKTREANEAYRRRVDNTLNNEQKKSWRDKGYDNAFGKGAMGSATVISIGSFSSSPGSK